MQSTGAKLASGLPAALRCALTANSSGVQLPRWEYVTTPLLLHRETAILNNWGAEGWELVQVVTGAEGGMIAFFKRPVSED
jgi:hypothetical protein